jgi:hypothetical protein
VSDEITAALERLRRLTVAAAAQAAAAGASPPPVPAPHQSDSDPAHREGNEEPPPIATEPPRADLRSSLACDIEARRGACARLRRVLADGAWHSALELLEVGGLRYGGRLHEIRHGDDGGPPLDVEGEPRSGERGRVWFYRVAPPRGQAPLSLGSDRAR